MRAIVLILMARASPLCAQAPTEYQVKAAFLYNFAKFVEWPGNSPATPFCIGILGSDPFGPMIDETLDGKTLGGRRVVIRRFDQPEEALGCEIVFIASAAEPLKSWLRYFQSKAILTVGDAPAFCQSGGIIGFQVADQRVRFAVNLEAARRAQLKMSSKLLSLAARVWGNQR
jgi:hypothetical protein